MDADIEKINPVDYYNRFCINDAIDILLDTTNVKKVDINSFTYIKNKSDELRKKIIIENGLFIIKEGNGLNLTLGEEYTPFMLIQQIKFNKNWQQTVSYVIHDIMGYKDSFIRVNTRYFKLIDKVDRFGINRVEMKLWDKITISDDFGRAFLSSIDKYDDFTMVPDNKNYSRVIGNNYNLYNEFSHKPLLEKPKDIESSLKWTFILLEHIFGEQYEIGINYIKVLYDYPKQILPILVLISEERQTGKTTFIDYLTILFGANTVIINPENIGSAFNASYTNKNIIIVEESRFENAQAVEKLKNLSTQKSILVNTKHVQEYSVPFYGKLIITSNDENKFSKVDDPEIRYWVRKIPHIKVKNHDILEDLTNEIPAFLWYLNTLKDVDIKRSRMVFTKDDLETEALVKVKKESRSNLYKDIEIYLDNFCLNNTKIKTIYFTAIDIKEKWFDRADVNYIRRVLKSEMKLKVNNSMRYIPFETNKDHRIKISARPFEYPNKYYDG